jgi:solute carrier family 35, member E3
MYGFHFATALTCAHLFSTYVLLFVGSQLALFSARSLPRPEAIKLACGSMGFIALTNLSLQYNSVGFYQIMKVMTLPVVAVAERVVYQRPTSKRVVMSLIVVCIGAVTLSLTDFKINILGSVYAVLAILTTAFYQVWGGALQKSLQCNALQLQLSISPWAGLMLTPLVPLFDNVSGSETSLRKFDFTLEPLVLIGLTCVHISSHRRIQPCFLQYSRSLQKRTHYCLRFLAVRPPV